MIIEGFNIRSFVVTVQEMPEKEQFIQQHFKEVGIEAESFSGMHFATSGLRTSHNYEVDNPGSGWNIGPRPVATWISFYMMWTAMRYMPEPYFWTLEWDARAIPNWRPMLEFALRSVPKDFDMLLLGSCCTADKPKTHIQGDVWDVRYPHCGHSTIIAAKALPVLLSTQRKVYAPLDLSLVFHTFPKLKVYTVLPAIFFQFGKDIPV